MNYLKSSSKVLACFRNSGKPTFIYLILTNHPNLFPNSNVFEIDLTSFHFLKVTEFKMEFQNQNKRSLLILTMKDLIMLKSGLT